MPRKHLFAVVVLLAAGAGAGLLAVTRTVELGPTAAASTTDAQITAKSRSLDRLEASLRRALAEQPPVLRTTGADSARDVQQRLVYEPPSVSASSSEYDEELEAERFGEYEHEHDDDD